MAKLWPTKQLKVSSLVLDAKNPRLGRESTNEAPSDIIEFLFEHDKAMELAESIAMRGYFPNEPLLAVREGTKYIVVEGNRRLAALKALREPGILDGTRSRKLERLARQIDRSEFEQVPVTIAPTRKDTDVLVAGRHKGTAVLNWQHEDRSSFILEKIEEGYDDDGLRDDLGFQPAEIQEAREVRAIARLTRSLDLPEEVTAKLHAPRPRQFSTIKRVFDSSAGKSYLMVEANSEHGLLIVTAKEEFKKGLARLVSDVVLRKQSSRSLNKNEQIKQYFESWNPGDLPKKKRARYTPDQIVGNVKGKPAPVPPPPKPRESKPAKVYDTVIPKSFKVRRENDRLVMIRDELAALNRVKFANVGAVSLRVFFELSVIDYLKRTGRYEPLIERLGGKRALQHGVPSLTQMRKEIGAIVDEKLNEDEATMVKLAIKRDRSAPFSVDELNSFVHREDFPTDSVIFQFWKRTQPLFELMQREEQAK